MADIYTIGYGNLSIEEFISRLKANGIDRIVDVRSVPYSHDENFREKILPARLAEEGIEYEFRGNELGGRPYDKSFYLPDGHVDYGAYGASQPVQHALREVLAEADEGITIALMCSEQKPEMCHRALMIAQEVYAQGIDMKHVTATGEVKDHSVFIREVVGHLPFPEVEDYSKEKFHSPCVIKCPDESYCITAHESETPMNGGTVYESVDYTYSHRTKENALWADLTVALAVDYETAGEQLTRSVAGDRYLAVPLPLLDKDYGSMYLADSIASRIASRLAEGHNKVNFAGNGIYTFEKHDISQGMLNRLLTNVMTRLAARGVDMEVRSGGQTGVDEAAIVAARANNYSWSVVCPRNFMMRDGKQHFYFNKFTKKRESRLDVMDKEQFCQRFSYEKMILSEFTESMTLEKHYAAHKDEKYINYDRAQNAKREPFGGFRIVGFTTVPEEGGQPETRYSYVDSRGYLLSDFIFTEANNFHNGAALVKTDEGYNFLTPAGTLMFDHPKSELRPFTKEGLAAIRLDEGHYNFVKRDAYLVNDEEYARVEDFDNGIAYVTGKDGRTNFITSGGNPIVSDEDRVLFFGNEKDIARADLGKMADWTAKKLADYRNSGTVEEMSRADIVYHAARKVAEKLGRMKARGTDQSVKKGKVM